jgi:hypothetical protein
MALISLDVQASMSRKASVRFPVICGRNAERSFVLCIRAIAIASRRGKKHCWGQTVAYFRTAELVDLLRDGRP